MSWATRVPILKPFEFAVLKANPGRIEIVIAGAEKKYFVWFSNKNFENKLPNWKHYVNYLHCSQAQSTAITGKQKLNIYNFLMKHIFIDGFIDYQAAETYRLKNRKKYKWEKSRPPVSAVFDDDHEDEDWDLQFLSDFGDKD